MAESRRWWGEDSNYEWERSALAHIRAEMPDRDPYRAWQCFSFTARTGHIRECDLFIVTPAGAFLVEIKSHPGRATNQGGTWFFHGNRVHTVDNPLFLTNQKAKELKSQLQWAANRRNLDVSFPFFQAGVFLSDQGLRCEFDEVQRQHVYGRERCERQTGLPGIWSGFLNSPHGRRPDPMFVRHLPQLMADIGVQGSRRSAEVGDFRLEDRVFDTGPTWSDYLAENTALSGDRRRIRIYHYSERDDAADRESIRRAAEREYRSLLNIAHDGIVKADTYVKLDHGSAVVFRHRDSWQRLDRFMRLDGAECDVLTRIEMVRQLAEALSYAHRNRLYHRSLAARSVWVEMDGRYPRVRIADWQVAAHRGGSTAGRTAHAGEQSEGQGTRALADHVEAAAQAYLAPEFTEFDSDPQALDVFGLGALTYLVLTGTPPGENRMELAERIRRHNALTPAAVSEDVTPAMDTLVRQATLREPEARTASVREFLEQLDRIEEQLTRPDVVTDPLKAVKGQEIINTWVVEKVLGKGATSRALLVKRGEERRVLKVALDDEGAVARLHEEAARLLRLDDRHIVKVVGENQPERIGERTALALEVAGDATLADHLRIEGSLSLEELRRFGENLMDIADYLEDEKVWHRDIKPDNLGVRERNRKGRELVLFDFSLAGTPPSNLKAGTKGYLDPFLELDGREYDAAAERYAIGVTLHEMASGQLPVWDEEGVEPEFLPLDRPLPRLAEENFPDQLREGLVAFFQCALHRDATRRYGSIAEMKDAWQALFRERPERPLTTEHSVSVDDADEVDDASTRDRNAEGATRDTPLAAAGLTPRAADAATRVLKCETVGDLIDTPVARLRRVRGLGLRFRNELVSRANQWRRRLGTGEHTGPVGVKLKDRSAEAKEQASLDKLLRQFIPRATEENRSWVRTARELLGVPEDAPARPVWPSQREVADRLGLHQTSVSQNLETARAHWRKSDLQTALRDDVVRILRRHGRLREVRQIAEELLALRGSTLDGPVARDAHALAAVRIAAELEERRESPRFVLRRSGSKVLAAEVIDDDPNVPVEADMLDYAVALGRAADELVCIDGDTPLPSPAEVRDRLRAVATKPGMSPLSDLDLVTLAAAASKNAAVTARLELYPLDLAPARALKLTQVGGYLGEPGITPQQLRDRVWARFPDLELPDNAEMVELLREEYPKLATHTVDGVEHWYLPVVISVTRQTRGDSGDGVAAGPGSPTEEQVGRRLDEAAARGGYVAVKAWLEDVEGAFSRLRLREDVRELDVAAELVATLRGFTAEDGGPSWDTVVEADRPGGASAFQAMVAEACDHIGRRVRELGERHPVLLHGVTPLARYPAGRDLLRVLPQEAREAGKAPYGLWLLCPMRDPQRSATVDGHSAGAVTTGEQLELPRGFGAPLPLAG